MAGRILIRSSAVLRSKSTPIQTQSSTFAYQATKSLPTFLNHLKTSHHTENSKQLSLTNLLEKSGFPPSQLRQFLSNNHNFLTNCNVEHVERSLDILLSFKIPRNDLVSMVLDCPGILELAFLKQWVASFSQIGLPTVSASMIRSMLEVSRRFQLEPTVFSVTVNLLKRLGHSDVAVTKVFEEYPEVALLKEQEILRTFEFLTGIGIRRDEINWVVYSLPRVLGFSVEDRLKTLINEFKELGFDEKVIASEIVREPRILGMELGELSRCLELLRSLKCRDRIKEKIFKDGDFRAAFQAKQRIECLCKHGLTRREAFKLLWKEPRLITYEIETIEKKLDYLSHKMKFSVESLMDVPEYLGINFEKQIVPRYNVIEYLGSKGWLGFPVGLREIIKPSRLKFYNFFVKPYPECEKMFEKSAGDNEEKGRHSVGLWKIFKPQRFQETK